MSNGTALAVVIVGVLLIIGIYSAFSGPAGATAGTYAPAHSVNY